MPLDLPALRDLALRAAEAGAEVVRAARRPGADAVVAETKGIGDYVTAVDRAAEVAVLAVLRAGAPHIPVIAEESSASTPVPPDGPAWAVDPVDGTTNFVRGFPIVGVSVGLLVDGEPAAGAVVAPLLGTGAVAARGHGAHDLDGARLRVRPPEGRGVAATGLPFRKPENRARYRAAFDRILDEVEDIRRAGAASLDLTWTAAGVFDGYFELGLSLWDVAAGGIVVREAGGVVTDWSGDPAGFLISGDVLAGAPSWHERMLDITRTPAALAPAVGGMPWS